MKIATQMIPALVAAALAAPFAIQAFAQAPAAQPHAEKAKASTARTFASPEEASKALTDAVRAKDANALLAVVGPGSGIWLFSGDKVADANDWQKFLAAYDAKHALENKDGRAILNVGDDNWPFPAPIVKHGSAWSFDANAGREEILNRRVGRNELDAIETLRAIVDAEREYAAQDADGNGYADYARRFRSSPGKKDGLFWPDDPSGKQSPLGPLVAEASREGYVKAAGGKAGPQAYHGYYFRILTSQGKDAHGGAYDYMVGDKLLGGFGVVAWPSNHGASGVMTFVVNHEGVVYEKDLGPQTAAIAGSMTRFNPDATWRKPQ
ncbi:MAG TPA: DUF2950 domain-containing protein [Usitatibacter sp.]|nr:DUF2950 domain-containing protein [Usitatibacter sp.]